MDVSEQKQGMGALVPEEAFPTHNFGSFCFAYLVLRGTLFTLCVAWIYGVGAVQNSKSLSFLRVIQSFSECTLLAFWQKIQRSSCGSSIIFAYFFIHYIFIPSLFLICFYFIPHKSIKIVHAWSTNSIQYISVYKYSFK